MIDETHSPARKSWIASANGHPEFPIQNLPFGVFTPAGSPSAAYLTPDVAAEYRFAGQESP